MYFFVSNISEKAISGLSEWNTAGMFFYHRHVAEYSASGWTVMKRGYEWGAQLNIPTCAFLNAAPSPWHKCSFITYDNWFFPAPPAADVSTPPPLQSNHLLTATSATQQTCQGFGDNWSWLGHNLIYTNHPRLTSIREASKKKFKKRLLNQKSLWAGKCTDISHFKSTWQVICMQSWCAHQLRKLSKISRLWVTALPDKQRLFN